MAAPAAFPSRRLDRLVFVPTIAAIAGVWIMVGAFTLAERQQVLDRLEGQLGLTVATLADANELAAVAEGTTADQHSATREAAVWRALLQYPAASIWVEAGGKIVAGQPPEGDLSSFIVLEEARGAGDGGAPRFVVHAALPRDEALSDWRASAIIRAGIALLASAAFLVLTNFLAAALRRRAAAEHETAAAMMRLVLRDRALEGITQGITITDDKAPGQPIIYTNPAFAGLTRYTLEEIAGRGLLAFFDADLSTKVAEKLEAARENKRPWRLEAELKRKDGTHFLDSISTSLIFDEKGEVSHSVAVHEDVTEVRQREELLMEAQKMESVGQLTGGIAHDFNNLLTAIRSNAEDLKEDLKDHPFHGRQMDIVLQAANRGAGLVAQLMAFARKQELQPKNVPVNDMLTPFSKLLRSTLPANIHIEVRGGEGLPLVHVDPGRLESALLNLAINARDAMPEGGSFVIETMKKHLDAGYVAENLDVAVGDYVMIAVTDTGTGMPQHVIERAFVPFFTTKEVGKGTGLGLSMVYGFVKQSGGHIKIYSEMGHGTVFKIYLPALSHGAQQGESNAGSAAAAGGSGSILLVEDDELVRQSISNKLTSLGYDVFTADNAHEAIETLKSRPHFDLVFSDVVMPGAMSGADLVREVRRRWPQINVLLTSGYTESTIQGKIQLPSDVKLLSKPYSNVELAAAIREALSKIAA